MARKMDQANVESRGRWVVLDPVFIEMLKDEDSRLLNGDFGGAGLAKRSGVEQQSRLPCLSVQRFAC
jgi:hypothetical protein